MGLAAELAVRENTFPTEHNSHTNEAKSLICKWINKCQATDNGLFAAFSDKDGSRGSIKFELLGTSSGDGDYNELLGAKVFETFGVYSASTAEAAFNDCVNCILTSSSVKIEELSYEEAHRLITMHCDTVLSLFQELRPRDVLELMMVTKVIMFNHLSTREFIASCSSAADDNTRGLRQSRGVKLSRLFLEFTDKLTKHRRPEQHIHVLHNHIHNEGNAIIGSHLSTGPSQ